MITKEIKKAKKQKPNNFKRVKKRLDILHSKVIRALEPACVCCGSVNQLTAGHIFSRRHLVTRWDIDSDGNVHTQCWPCNYKHVRDQYPYFNWYIEKFGLDKFEELRSRHNQDSTLKTFHLLELEEQLKTVLKTMEEQNV